MLVGLALVTACAGPSAQEQAFEEAGLVEVGRSSPEATAERAFEVWVDTPYRNASFDLVETDGTFATISIVVEFRETPGSGWTQHSTTVGCRKVGNEWRCDTYFDFQSVPTPVPVEVRTESVSAPREDIEVATVKLDVGPAEFTLDKHAESANLIEVDISHYGELVFEVIESGDQADVKLEVRMTFPPWLPSGKQERWDVRLNPDVLYEIELDAGSGTYDLDLSGLRVTDCRLDLGSGEFDITLPDSMEARIRLDRGGGNFRPGPRFQLVQGKENADGIWETDGYDEAADCISIEIDMGSGDVTIR